MLFDEATTNRVQQEKVTVRYEAKRLQSRNLSTRGRTFFHCTKYSESPKVVHRFKPQDSNATPTEHWHQWTVGLDISCPAHSQQHCRCSNQSALQKSQKRTITLSPNSESVKAVKSGRFILGCLCDPSGNGSFFFSESWIVIIVCWCFYWDSCPVDFKGLFLCFVSLFLC